MLAFLLCLGACTEAEVDLYIDVKTDLSPGVEFRTVRTELFDQPPQAEESAAGDLRADLIARRGEPFVDGLRAAEFAALSPGTYHARVRLLGADDRPLLQRLAVLTVRETSVFTITLTRDCRGVVCPASDPVATTCLGGRCVDPRCSEETPEYCGAPACGAASECDPPTASCAEARCEAGVCLAAVEDLSCAPEEYCDPDVGCAALPPGGPTVGRFVPIAAGTFDMGSPVTEVGREDDEVLHQVTLTRPFYLQETEVTFAAWRALMGTDPPELLPANKCDTCPAAQINFFEVLSYANALSVEHGRPPCYTLVDCTGTAGAGRRDGLVCTDVTVTGTGSVYDCEGYRLPTEAEWEYAYRAGTTTPFYDPAVTTGDCSDGVFDALGWSVCNAVDPQPVGGKAENPWGLYDMAGNVFEWVWDYHGPYDSAPVVDPEASSPDSSRALRGGAVYNDSRALRAAYRNLAAESHLEPMRGFRVARMLVPPGG